MRQYLSWFRASTRCDRAGPPEYQNSATDAPAGAEAVIRRLRGLSSDLVTVHGAGGSVEDCDFSTGAFFGLAAEDLLGGSLLARVHVADRPGFLDALDRALHGEDKVALEYRFRINDDDAEGDAGAVRFVWLEMFASPFTAEGDGEPHVIALSRDISRLRAREHELLLARQVAEEANEAKTRFLHNMSHELRTPLNAIIGFSEMMSMPGIFGRDERQMSEYAGIVHSSGKHLLGLIDEVLDMSRLEAGKYRLSPETFRVADLVRNAIELVQHEMEAKGVKLTVREFDPALAMINDRRVCRQTLVNLLAGQIKASAEKGRLRLRVETEGGEIAFAITRAAAGTVGELRPGGSLLEALVTLIGGEVRIIAAAEGQEGVEVRLPVNAGASLADDNIVRLRAKAPQEEPSRQQIA